MVSKCFYHSSNDDQLAADYPLSKGRPDSIIINPYSPSRSIGIFRRAMPNVAARFSFTATTIGQDLYLIGGLTSPDITKNPIANDILRVEYSSLNVDQQTTKLTVQGHGAIPVGSNILIFFGQQSLTPQQFAAPIQQVDPATGAVTNVPNKGNIPASRFDHSVTVVNKKAYIIGGSTLKGVLKDVSYFDLDTSTWHTLDATKFPDNAAISGHATVPVNNLLVSCFGLDAKNALRADCIVFDTDKNQFVQPTVSGNAPAPRSDVSMTVGNNTSKIVVFGGMDAKTKTAFNDVYVLDASKAPTLVWQQVKTDATNNTLIPSPRGGHIATTLGDDKVMMVWGGIGQGRNMADNSMYYFDTTNNVWVDESEAINLIAIGSNATSTGPLPKASRHGVSGGIIAAVIGIIVLVALIGIFIVRRRKFRKTASFDREVNNDPYIRPGGQLNESFSDLSLHDNASWYTGRSAEPVTLEGVMTSGNMEIKEPQRYANVMRRPSTASAESEKHMILYAQEMANSLPPMPTVTQNIVPKPDSLRSMPSITPDPAPQEDSLPPTPTSMPIPSPVPYSSPLPSPRSMTSVVSSRSSSESSHVRKGHRRTSSVSLTAADLACHVFPKPPYRNSMASSRSFSSQPFHRPRSSLSQVFGPELEETDQSPSDNHSKEPSLGSVSNDAINALSSPKTPLSPSYSEESSDIPMQYYNMDGNSPVDPEFLDISNNAGSTESMQLGRNSYDVDHKDIFAAYDGQRRDSEPFQFPSRDDINNPSEDMVEQGQTYNHERTGSDDRLQTIEEIDVLDPYPGESGSSRRGSINNNEVGAISTEEKKRLSKRKKRSSGRVSFAMVHEKIEFDETQSSRSVSLANSTLSAIHEDNINGDDKHEDFSEIPHNPDETKDSNDIDIIRPLRLYEDEDDNGQNSSSSRVSRFSFSVYDFTTDDPMPSNAVEIVTNAQTQKAEEYRPPSPVKRTVSPDVRNSIAEVALDGGVLYALI